MYVVYTPDDVCKKKKKVVKYYVPVQYSICKDSVAIVQIKEWKYNNRRVSDE